MKEHILWVISVIIAFPILQGCAASTPPPGDSPPIPLQEANLEAVLEQQEGLEVVWEDAKELRDFYRGGVQQKAKAEKKFQERAYPDALKLYGSSNDFFLMVLKYIDEDSAEYVLFERTQILFFPNLLMADNYLKMGRILKEMGREGSARRQWKRALPYAKQSLRSERTQWGLSLQQELAALLDSPKR